MTKPALAAVALAAVAAAAAVGTYSYKYVQQQRSLRQGIAQTEQSLQQVSQLLEENRTALNDLISETLIKFAGDSPLKDIAELHDIYKNGFDAATAFQNQDYLKGTGQTAEAIAAVWGKLDPNVELGTKTIDAAAAVYEAQSLLRAQQQLLQVQLALQQQLFRLQGKDPETLAQWQQILNNLYGDPAAQHAAFLQWLAAHGLSEKDVKAKALADASAAGPAVASQLASGITIVDPDQGINDLYQIPGINPDFIASIKCERDGAQSILTGGDGMTGDSCPRCCAGDPCDRYCDGSWINAFGPPNYDPNRSSQVPADQIPGLFRSRKPAPETSAMDSAGVYYNATEFTFLNEKYSAYYQDLKVVPEVFTVQIKINFPQNERGVWVTYGSDGESRFYANGSNWEEHNTPEAYPPGTYTLRYYRGLWCCGLNLNEKPWIEDASDPMGRPVGHVDSLKQRAPTDSFQFTVKQGSALHITSGEDMYLRYHAR